MIPAYAESETRCILTDGQQVSLYHVPRIEMRPVYASAFQIPI